MTTQMKQPVDKKFIVVSKTDAARRQMETACKLFFRDQDPVSIHTLASAAYGIMLGMCKKRTLISPPLKSTAFIKQGKEKEFMDIMNKAENFFKHGSSDANEQLKYNPEASTYYLFDSIRIYSELTGERTALMKAFQVWFQVRHPNYFDQSQILAITKQLNLNPADKVFFLDLAANIDATVF